MSLFKLMCIGTVKISIKLILNYIKSMSNHCNEKVTNGYK